MKRRAMVLLAALAVTLTACDNVGPVGGGGWYPIFIQQPAPVIQQPAPAYRQPAPPAVRQPAPAYRAPAPAPRPPAVRTR